MIFKRKTKWILCKEELPTQDGTYLITTKNGAVTVSHFYEKHNRFSQQEKLGPIAWRTMPAPYKEG